MCKRFVKNPKKYLKICLKHSSMNPTNPKFHNYFYTLDEAVIPPERIYQSSGSLRAGNHLLLVKATLLQLSLAVKLTKNHAYLVFCCLPTFVGKRKPKWYSRLKMWAKNPCLSFFAI